MPKGPVVASQSAPNSRLPKNKYNAPRCNRLTPDEAKAKLKSAGLGDAAAKQLLQRIVQLKIRKQGRR